MSEEILVALTELFAIITRQDGGVTVKEREYVINSFKKKLNQDSVKKYIDLYDAYSGYIPADSAPDRANEIKAENKTSVKDSLQTLAICKKVNQTLTHKQKIIVLTELYELVKADENFTTQRMLIIEAVCSAFNIDDEDFKTIEDFILKESLATADNPNILIINNDVDFLPRHPTKYLYSPAIDGNLYFMIVRSVNLIFFKFLGTSTVYLNGKEIEHRTAYLFSHAATIKTQDTGFYYSDIVANLRSEILRLSISFNVKNISYNFSKNKQGLKDISISEGSGKLIGIMGSSGAGKTTLLNVMAGLTEPSSGEVLINGINIHKEKENIRGVIGYISQDDLLIEELTVYENLFYNAKLCFKDLSNADIGILVDKILDSMGLQFIKGLEVGSIFNKKISGGQRKRLNIALELIREPSILFVDEPTSGLSSRDSENVIDLLKELTLKGKLIFVVIHQPSSDVYKMFDKILLLDTGGYQVYYGHPIEAITYLKMVSKQIDSDNGQCDACGNVNPEQIFNIIEEKVVDEFGNLTEKRKITPLQWNKHFRQNVTIEYTEDVKALPVDHHKIPGRIKQWLIFTKRDLLSKFNNKNYLFINLLEAPLLALLLAFIIRYKNDRDLTKYIFRFNENIPAYLLMAVIVAMFIGMSVSAEEIIKDRKILKRESFLNLSRTSYLISKICILFSISAIQTLLFVMIGNSILEIKGLALDYWLVLFSVCCMANILGLIISSGFDNAVSVYILIPLLLIPQMILSGAIFSFDKVNDLIKSKDRVPILADLMGSRWAFEALAVSQFKNNDYEKIFYHVEQIESISNFNLVYLLPELRGRLWFIENNGQSADKEIQNQISKNLTVLYNELLKQRQIDDRIDTCVLRQLSAAAFNKDVQEKCHAYINDLGHIYRKIFSSATRKKEHMIIELERGNHKQLKHLKDNYFNESLSDLVRNVNTKNRITEENGKLFPGIEFIFFNPIDITGHLDYRSHFFSPTKHFIGSSINTYAFNTIAIWVINAGLFVMLYLNIFRRIILSINKIGQRW
jgi:ABC-type multidrug transport system ATPase subunit